MLMDLKEKIVKSILMTVKIMTVKTILRALMELITTRAFAHLSTQVGRIGNALLVYVSENIRETPLHMFSKLLFYSITGRSLGN